MSGYGQSGIRCVDPGLADAVVLFRWLTLLWTVTTLLGALYLLRRPGGERKASLLLLASAALLSAAALWLHLDLALRIGDLRTWTERGCLREPGTWEVILLTVAGVALALGSAWWLRRRGASGRGGA